MEYVMCEHPGHAAVCEIMSRGEFEKFVKMGEPYKELASDATKNRLIERLRESCEAACVDGRVDRTRLKEALSCEKSET